jgi:hypothetical protein
VVYFLIPTFFELFKNFQILMLISKICHNSIKYTVTEFNKTDVVKNLISTFYETFQNSEKVNIDFNSCHKLIQIF